MAIVNGIREAYSSYFDALQNTAYTAAGSNAGNIVITGNGNDVISVDGDSAVVIAGEGNDTVDVTGKNAVVNAGNGNNNVSVKGDNAVVLAGNGNDTVNAVSNNATIITGNGKNDIDAVGNNALIVAGNGDDDVSYVGNGSMIELGEGNNDMNFWGNNNRVAAGNGNNVIYTDTTLTNAASTTTVTQNTAHATQVATTVSTFNNTSFSASGNTRTTLNTTSESASTRWYDIATTTKTTTVTEAGTTGNQVYLGTGANNVDIANNGHTIVYVDPKSKNNNTIDISAPDSTSKTELVSTTKTDLGKNSSALLTTNYDKTSYTYDPLVIDANKDGTTNTQLGEGVELAEGHSVAAVNGDKMLSIGDLDGDGKIEGTEVLGNFTVSPFTGQALGAANGFDALDKLASEVLKYMGINVYSTYQGTKTVDMAALKSALEQATAQGKTVGKATVGLISDSNTKTLEGIGTLKYIGVAGTTANTAAYANTTDASHKQVGFYIDSSGKVWGAVDANA